MDVAFIQEPALEFGGGKHIDIRFGLMNHGPLDLRTESAPQRVRLGIVGTPEGVEGIHKWVESIGGGVTAKESRQPNLFPRFPRTLPARVVVHKTSPHNEAELDGFREALDANGVDSADFLSVGRSFTRPFRDGGYPPLRGTFLSLDRKTHALYTRGSVDFFATYPGQYVPNALRLLCADVEQTPVFLAREILALTKMNWNNTQFDNRNPITIEAARGVGDILKYVEEGHGQSRCSYYM